MDVAQITANALPFLMAYVVQLFSRSLHQLTDNVIKVLLPKDEVLEGYPRDFAVELAIHVHGQLNFILSILLSTVSALALTLTSKRPTIVVIAAFGLLVLIVAWIFRWQTLSVDESQRKKRDKEMFWVSLATTTVMLVTTLYARSL